MGNHDSHADIVNIRQSAKVMAVAVSRLHLPVHQAVAVALVVATVKGGLVASYFMHLISERKLILWVLGFTVAFFFFVLLLPLWTHWDPIHY